MPSTSPYFGLTAATAPENPPTISWRTIRLPAVPDFGLAPTSATERASSIARRAVSGATASGSLLAAAQGQAFLHVLPAAVAPDLAQAVAGGDRADPAAGVGRRGGLVEPAYRGAVVRVPGDGARVEELVRRQLAVEDVAPDKAQLLLHVVRPENLTVQDRTLQVRRELGVAVDHAVRVSLELLAVRLLRPLVRDPLREERHDVIALGAERAVEHRRYDPVGERPARRYPAPCVLERLLDVVDRVG